MKKITNSIYITLFALCFLLQVQAQTNNPNLERELNLEKEYNPSLRDANKINQLPEIKEPEAPQTKVEFSNYTSNELIPPYITNLKAQTYFSNFATSEKRGYLNVGVSTLIDIDGDLGYQLLNSEKDFLSIFASHRSSNSDVTHDIYYGENFSVSPINKNQKMKINDNVGGLNYIHRFGKVNFLADAQYTYSGFNYYAFQRGTFSNPINKDRLYIGAMLGSTDGIGLYSKNNQEIFLLKEFGDNLIQKAQFRGNQEPFFGYHILGYYQLTLLQCLLLIKFKSLNLKGFFGNKATSIDQMTGSLYSENFHYIANSGSTKIFGIENLVNNNNTEISGIVRTRLTPTDPTKVGAIRSSLWQRPLVGGSTSTNLENLISEHYYRPEIRNSYRGSRVSNNKIGLNSINSNSPQGTATTYFCNFIDYIGTEYGSDFRDSKYMLFGQNDGNQYGLFSLCAVDNIRVPEGRAGRLIYL